MHLLKIIVKVRFPERITVGVGSRIRKSEIFGNVCGEMLTNHKHLQMLIKCISSILLVDANGPRNFG